MAGTDLPAALREEILALLEPLSAAARAPTGLLLLMRSVGLTDDASGRPALRQAIERVAGLLQVIADLPAPTLDSWNGVAQLLSLAEELFASARDIETAVSDPAVADQTRDLGRDLIDMLAAAHLRARWPTLLRVASLLTLVTPAELAPAHPMVTDGSTVRRLGRRGDRLDLARLQPLLKDPTTTLSEHYFPNRLDGAADASMSAQRLFPLLRLLAQTVGLKAYEDRAPVGPVMNPSASIEVNQSDHFGDDEDDAGADAVSFPERQAVDLTPYHASGFPRLVVVLPGLTTAGDSSAATLALALRLSSASHPGGARGAILEVLGQLALAESRGGWHLTVESDGQLPAVVLGPDGLTFAPVGPTSATAGAHMLLSREVSDGTPAFRLGGSTGSRLDVGALQIGASLAIKGTEAALQVSCDARSGSLVLSGDDGFLASLLPRDGLRVDFDLGLVWSSLTGLTLRGAAGLEAVLPVGRSIGPVTLTSVHLGLGAEGSGLHAKVTGDLTATLGPVRALILDVGLEATLSFPAEGGNLGPAALSLGPRLPSGIGLAIDAGALIAGGGVLFRDPAKALYAGVLQLCVRDSIDVRAFGLITTRMPDGSSGYSLIVFITAEGFKPIQLGLGFTLLGIGGMLAVNRSFDEGVLRAGLKNDTLGSLLFPRDPVAHAASTIHALAAAFPARGGSHLVGLLVRIGWFTPTLITADLAVIMELGARKRLLLLGRVRMLLPSESEPLLRITLDAIGVFDFDEGTAAIDAVLVDSRLLERFVLTGAAALRARWSRPRSFALSVGGMNPGFNLPADFPALERLTLSLTTGSNPRLTCDAYFAVTSNTVQFGAHAHLYAAAFGFNVTGDVSFDVLITLSPFHFLAEIVASMQLRRGSSNLFKVKVEGALEGPAPLLLRAKATFEILWWDVSIRVNATLAEGAAPALPAAVDVLALLRAALRHARNWHATLPGGQGRVVHLRELAGSPAGAPASVLWIHPLATPSVRQGVVPLNLQRDIERFGQAPVAGARRFPVTAASIDAQSVASTVISDDFAPAQFFEMSDDEKLAAPQYEGMPAGLAFGAPLASFDLAAAVGSPLDYETKLIDAQAAPDEPPPKYRLSDLLMAHHARHGAAGRSALTDGASVTATPFVALRVPGYAVADAELLRIDTSRADIELSHVEAVALAAGHRGRRAVPVFQVHR